MKQTLIPGKWYMVDPYNTVYRQKWYILFKRHPEYGNPVEASAYFDHDGYYKNCSDSVGEFAEYKLPYVLADPNELNPLLAKQGLPPIEREFTYEIF